jgi:hypothetical protein
VESARELSREVWPNSQAENSGKIPPKGATIEKLTDWIRNHNYAIPVRLPSKNEFVHVGGGYRALSLEFWTLRDDVNGELYAINSDDARLWRVFEDYFHKIGKMGFVIAISEDSSLFLWPYLEELFSPAIDAARSGWVRVVTNRAFDGYRLDFRSSELATPFCPLLTREEILRMAFKSRIITSFDHPLIKKLAKRMSRTFVPSFVPLFPNHIPSKLMSESKPGRKISGFLGEQIAEELTGWIHDRGYKISVRQPLDGEIVYMAYGADSLRHAMPTVMDDATGDVYRVSHDLIYETRAQFVHLYGSMSFALTMSSSGSMFLWPVMSKSLRESLKEKKCLWVRVSFDGASEPRLSDLPQGKYPEPIWPDLNLGEIIDMGFQSRVIESLHHPLIKRLHGNVIVFPGASIASP